MLASPLLNHLIRPPEQRRRNRQAEGLGGLEVDDQFELGGLFNRKIGGLRSPEDLVDVDGGAADEVGVIGAIRHEASRLGIDAVPIYGGKMLLGREVDDLSPGAPEKRRAAENDGVHAGASDRGKDCLEAIGSRYLGGG